MKIFIMNPITPPGIDGSIVHRYELVKNLAELGIEVHVITKCINIGHENVHLHTSV